MTKRILLVMLSLMLAAAAFAGCTKKTASSSSSAAPSSSAVSSMPGSLSESGASGSVSGDLSESMLPDSGAVDNSGVTSGSGSMAQNGSTAAATAAAMTEAWELRLVNASHPLPDGFNVETRAISGYENRRFDARAADALEAMLDGAEQAGYQLYLVSAYRSVERQTALFNRKVQAYCSEGMPQEEAEKQAARWVARPGTSEHNLGLAADLVSANWYSAHNDLTEEFEQTPHFAWLQAHCAEYGFILRYPKGKEIVTGVSYEPWHYRYVGKEAAAAIMAAGQTLEEYCT